MTGQFPTRDDSLDPDWEAMRKSSHEVVDDMIDYLKNIRSRPVWQSVPDDVKQYFTSDLPETGEDFDSIYGDIQDKVLPYPMGNIHPKFWGWVLGTGTYQAALADFIASVMNPNLGGAEHVANHVELQVLKWSKEMFGFPDSSSGLITSGGTMANLIGLTVARYHQTEHDIRKHGIADHKLRYYGSNQMHSSLQKSIELLGIGSENLIEIPVDDEFKIKIPELEQQIQNDIEKGFTPVCIIGNLGTTNTGAFDDLHALAELSEKYNLWFHVDGAFGSMTKLTSNYSHIADGMERCDSLAFDFHKWMYVNHEAGGVLIRNRKSHYNSFSLTPDYLAHGNRGAHGGKIWFSDYGVELSRGFKALKIWLTIKEHGIKKFGRVIERNIEQAKYLTDLIKGHQDLELMAPTTMNIVCFRFTRNGLDLDTLNEEILIQLHERDIAVPTYTRINGEYTIRAAITNHRSQLSDFDLLVNAVVDIGHELLQKSEYVVQNIAND